VSENPVVVHEVDVIGGVENLDWLHEVTFVRRMQLEQDVSPGLDVVECDPMFSLLQSV
jgi:hypothetical protein